MRWGFLLSIILRLLFWFYRCWRVLGIDRTTDMKEPIDIMQHKMFIERATRYQVKHDNGQINEIRHKQNTIQRCPNGIISVNLTVNSRHFFSKILARCQFFNHTS
ncbi:hypothetical protein DLR64_18840 [Vibrio tarriae]|nr:hypothetical protein DLR64_18840 [Vibrio tarriae]